MAPPSGLGVPKKLLIARNSPGQFSLSTYIYPSYNKLAVNVICGVIFSKTLHLETDAVYSEVPLRAAD